MIHIGFYIHTCTWSLTVVLCSIFAVPAFGLQPDIEGLEENFSPVVACMAFLECVLFQHLRIWIL